MRYRTIRPLTADLPAFRLHRCVQACQRAHELCVQTALQQLENADAALGTPQLHLMMDCAALCLTVANFLTSGLGRSGWLCAWCADRCRACARRCVATGGMDACAQACRQCAEQCEAMAMAAAGQYAGGAFAGTRTPRRAYAPHDPTRPMRTAA